MGGVVGGGGGRAAVDSAAEEQVHSNVTATAQVEPTRRAHGSQAKCESGRRWPPPGVVRLGLRTRTRSVCRRGHVHQLATLQPGDPQRTLHGVVAPQRLGAAPEEKRWLP